MRIALASIAAIVALTSTTVTAEPNRVAFPDNLEDLEHYTTVRRGNVTEFMYTSAKAIAAIQAGDELPFGTQVILQDWRAGEVYRLFVMEKGEGWGEEYTGADRTDDWQFQWYWPDGSINMGENTQRCRSCHMAREERSFMYTFNDARRYE